MSLKDLTWPIRIYWDLPEHDIDLDQVRAIARELLELKVLFLGLSDSSATLSPACLAILNELKDKHIALSLTMPGACFDPTFCEQLSPYRIKSFLLRVTTLDQARSCLPRLAGVDPKVIPAGISFDAGPQNYHEIPALVAFCLQQGIPALDFPIQRLTAARTPFCFSEKELHELSPRLEGLPYDNLKLTIHDPFLWPLFHPEKEYHESGCQAGNSMLYIDPDLVVFPCPAMPFALGDLQEESLRSIILSEGKKELRQVLREPPAECTRCARASQCLGGCRGRALRMKNSLDHADPACDVRQ